MSQSTTTMKEEDVHRLARQFFNLAKNTSSINHHMITEDDLHIVDKLGSLNQKKKSSNEAHIPVKWHRASEHPESSRSGIASRILGYLRPTGTNAAVVNTPSPLSKGNNLLAGGVESHNNDIVDDDTISQHTTNATDVVRARQHVDQLNTRITNFDVNTREMTWEQAEEELREIEDCVDEVLDEVNAQGYMDRPPCLDRGMDRDPIPAKSFFPERWYKIIDWSRDDERSWALLQGRSKGGSYVFSLPGPLGASNRILPSRTYTLVQATYANEGRDIPQLTPGEAINLNNRDILRNPPVDIAFGEGRRRRSGDILLMWMINGVERWFTKSAVEIACQKDPTDMLIRDISVRGDRRARPSWNFPRLENGLPSIKDEMIKRERQDSVIREIEQRSTPRQTPVRNLPRPQALPLRIPAPRTQRPEPTLRPERVPGEQLRSRRQTRFTGTRGVSRSPSPDRRNLVRRSPLDGLPATSSRRFYSEPQELSPRRREDTRRRRTADPEEASHRLNWDPDFRRPIEHYGGRRRRDDYEDRQRGFDYGPDEFDMGQYYHNERAERRGTNSRARYDEDYDDEVEPVRRYTTRSTYPPERLRRATDRFLW
ncbi:hypothetical protein FPRO03_03444 [Fusarium proliferatum]|nr:hypothetical protein FPRO03_03444 [Fusarium proliferatum]